MRRHSLWLGFILFLSASGLSAQKGPLKVCVSQDGEGYDAFRLARQLSARKLKSGASLAVVAITGKALSAKEEHDLADPATPFVRVLLLEWTDKSRDAALERLGCEYNIKIWYHESADSFDANAPAGVPSPGPGSPKVPPTGDQTSVGYELRKAGNKKVIAGGTAPPGGVYARTGAPKSDPYLLFANQIVKKLNGAS